MTLFEDTQEYRMDKEALGPGAVVLRRFALPGETALLTALNEVIVQAPFRQMMTPGGFLMSVAMTNCGIYGWVSDHTGYRYETLDPQSGQPWPLLPDPFLALAQQAAAQADFPAFVPDACLINRYAPGAKLSLHQDKDERDLSQPIVSVSLGLPAIFLFGGLQRADRQMRVPVSHGDVIVWGGPARLRYHGIQPLKPGSHLLVGTYRLNLTFRKAR
jgi:alkylated DNA repair protein (DNA oxidative demethylase)